MEIDHRRPLVIFSLVVVYVIFQFAWWAYLLLDQSGKVAELQEQLLLLGAIDPTQAVSYSPWMVVSEGLVFLLLLLLGVWLTYRTLRRELSLATVQHDFLLAVTHELRTPIAAMRLNLQTMQRDGVTKAQHDEILAQAISDTSRLELLSNKILLATQLEDKALFLDQRNCRVDACVERSVDQATKTYGAKHNVRCDLQQRLEWPVDEVAFRSICDNLLENACKYSPQGTTIIISLMEKDHSLCLRVQDQGSGVPEKDRPYIFDKFHRSTENGHQAKGSGLGLYIVASLVKLMNGKIIQKPGDTQGSIFEVCIPNVE